MRIDNVKVMRNGLGLGKVDRKWISTFHELDNFY